MLLAVLSSEMVSLLSGVLIVHEMHLSLSFQSLLENAELKDTLFLFPRSSVTWFCQSMINSPWLGEILPRLELYPVS